MTSSFTQISANKFSSLEKKLTSFYTIDIDVQESPGMKGVLLWKI